MQQRGDQGDPLPNPPPCRGRGRRLYRGCGSLKYKRRYRFALATGSVAVQEISSV